MADDRLILRGADGYNEACFSRIFNTRRPERYPSAVLVAESENDVVEGVRQKATQVCGAPLVL